MRYFGWAFIERVVNGIRRRTIGEKHTAFFYKLRSISRAKAIEVWCFPHRSQKFAYTIEKVFAELGVKVVSQPTNKTTFGFVMEDSTTNELYASDNLLLLNGKCTDISKAKVERVFEEVFGYSLAIDPLTYQGQGVCKSDRNAAHDGYVLQFPISQREPAKVYERLIDNSTDGGAVEDIRMIVVGNRLPAALLKRRYAYQRFLDTNFSVSVANVDQVTSASERALIVKFAKTMGLDFGELDVLRDRSNGKIFIVDANKTPTGPSARLWFFSRTKIVKTIAAAFESEFLAPLAQAGEPSRQANPIGR